jgi:lipopolysaccharide transport system ATP-binding protein
MKPAIIAENVSKKYRLARSMEERLPYRTLRDDIVRWASWPVRWARGRTIRREDFWALKDVSFRVQPGETVGVIGRNGAGKSTLLKVLSRITKPTGGRVRLRGRVGSLLEVGTGFHPELTGRENIYLSGAVLGMTRAEMRQKFDEIVAFAEVERFLDTPVKRYSSGMYMRLAFAVASHMEPEILLVDEVLAVGDVGFQKKCMGKMGEVARGGRAVVFVSHNMTAVLSLCDRAMWLSDGEVRLDGPVRQVITRYTEAGGAALTRRRWDSDAPAGDRVWLRSAEIVPCDGTDVNEITVRTPLRFDFEFQTAFKHAVLNFSVVLDELDRGCVFNTGSAAIPCSSGLIRGSFVIPGNLLNDGMYTVRVLLVRDTSIPLFDRSDILGFQVHDVERTGNWYGRWIGAVRPTLDWQVTSVPDGASEPEGA